MLVTNGYRHSHSCRQGHHQGRGNEMLKAALHYVAATAAVAVMALLATPPALADIAFFENFSVDRNGVPIFADTFALVLTFPGGTGTAFSSGRNFLDNGAAANYFVRGTVPQVASQAMLNTSNGI